MIWAMNTENRILLMCFSFTIAIMRGPVLPIACELSCEIGFPIGEAYCNGTLSIFGSIF